jgi:hypothetical protein
MPSIAAELTQVNRHLASIETTLLALPSIEETQQALADILEMLGQLAQFREVYATQRDAVAALLVIANLLLAEERTHGTVSSEQREQLRQLLLRLLDIGQRHEAGLYDLERAVYGGLTPEERARNEGEQ